MKEGIRLDATIDRRFEEYVGLLQDLVRQPSLLGQERPAQEVLARHINKMGLMAELWEPDVALLERHPAYAPGPGLSYSGRPNLSAVLPAGRSGGRSLCLNGHIDVVSPGPAAWWTVDPWGAEIRNGRLYGRGSMDMKGGLVMALLAMEAVMMSELPLTGPVHFESTVEEECTGNGTLAARLRMGPVDGAIITEPLGPGACMADMGVLWFQVRVQGRPGYVGAGDPISAIEKTAALIPFLRRLEDRINRECHHPAYREIKKPSRINFGTIQSGDWPSRVPLQCDLTCRISYPPGVKVSAVKSMLADALAEAGSVDSWFAEFPPAVSYPGFQAEGSHVSDDSRVLQSLRQSYFEVTGAALPVQVFPGGADGRYFNLYGYGDALYYGPIGAGIHAPDEWVDLESIRQGARVLARFIVDWCGAETH